MKGKKKILVTGGAGYIGSHCVKKLCEAGHEVSVLDNFSLGLHENIDQRVKEVFKGDVRKSEDIKTALKDIDVVFHFAAWKAAGESMLNPGKYAENNICGTLKLLETMTQMEVKYFVFSSSAAVYGNPEYLPIDEKHPTNPMNYYGFSKLTIEKNLRWYSQLKGIHFAALRYFNATGYDVDAKIKGKEKNPANLSPIVMEVAAKIRHHLDVYGNNYSTPDGTCIRDYIHVNDLADAHLLAMEYIVENHKNIIANLGTGRGYSVFEVIDAAEKACGAKIPYRVVERRPGDPAQLVASCDHARQLLGWKARYSDLDIIFKSMANVYLR